MGKTKKIRKKYHLTSTNSQINNDNSENSNTSSTPNLTNTNLKQDFKFPENIFEKVNISSESLKQTLIEDDARSILTTKSTKSLFKNQNLRKDDKRKLRREAFLNKIEFLRHIKEEAKKKKKRMKTVITGDLKPLLDTLPQIESSVKKVEKKITKKRGILKAKNRQKKLISDIAFFQNVFEDPSYKKNPFDKISTIVQERILSENSFT